MEGDRPEKDPTANKMDLAKFQEIFQRVFPDAQNFEEMEVPITGLNSFKATAKINNQDYSIVAHHPDSSTWTVTTIKYPGTEEETSTLIPGKNLERILNQLKEALSAPEQE